MALSLSGVQFLAAVGVGAGGIALIALLIVLFYVSHLTVDIAELKKKLIAQKQASSTNRTEKAGTTDTEFHLLKSKQEECLREVQSAQKDGERLGLQLSVLMDKMKLLESRLAKDKHNRADSTEKSAKGDLRSEINHPVHKFITLFPDSAKKAAPGPEKDKTKEELETKHLLENQAEVAGHTAPSHINLAVLSDDEFVAGGQPVVQADIGPSMLACVLSLS
jgi:hypothetical protein